VCNAADFFGENVYIVGVYAIRYFIALSFLAFFAALQGAKALEMPSDTYNDIFSYSDCLDASYGGADGGAGTTAFPVLNVPMGGSAEGLGGAFSAVCDDISFIESNPAGSAMLSLSSLAFFHNNWIADTKVEAAAYSRQINNFGFGVAGKWLYTPFTEYDEWGKRESTGYYSEALATLNFSYKFFPGYYFSGFALGMNLKGALRITPEFADYTRSSQSGAAIMADIGILTRLNFLKFYNAREKNFSLAVVLRNFGADMDGDPLPTVAVAGIAYKPFRPISISFDFSFPFDFMHTVGARDESLAEKPYAATGVSVALAKFLSLRAGFMLRSGASRITVGSAIALSSITFDVNYTLDLLTQIQPMNRITLGIRMELGDGGLAAKNRRVDDLYLKGLDAYAAGKESIAIDFFNQALKINPRFDPAIQAIRAIENAMAINNRIKNLESFDY
jgi:tetratricopeptide (TPR) repeat protein